MPKTSVKEFKLVDIDLLVSYANNARTHYVENTGDADNVYCIRNGRKVAYADVVKQVE